MTSTDPIAIADAVGAAADAGRRCPFRFTAYDGSAAGPEDAPIAPAT